MMKKFAGLFVAMVALCSFSTFAAAEPVSGPKLSANNIATVVNGLVSIGDISSPFSVYSVNVGAVISQIGHRFSGEPALLNLAEKMDYRTDASTIGVATLAEDIRLHDVSSLDLDFQINLDARPIYDRVLK